MNEPKKLRNIRCKYGKEALKAAMEAVKGGMTLNAASVKYHVPRSTLLNRKRANFADKRPGPDTILTPAEEETLVAWIQECYERGIYVGKQQLLNSVAMLVSMLNRPNPFANGRPGRHWYQAFLRRHENIGDRLTKNGQIVKRSVTKEGIEHWFAAVKSHMERENLLDIHPSRVFVLETVNLLNPDSNDDRENLSVLVAGNAAGQLAPCMVLFKCQRIYTKVYNKMPEGWTCSKTETGAMSPQLLFDYVTKTFCAWLSHNKMIEYPIVLFVNGRTPHVTLTLTDFCSRNNIELLSLYPNASSELDPLTSALFPPMKKAWNLALTNHRAQTRAKALLNEDVAPCLNIVMNGLNVVQILTNAFEQCGLHPFSEEKCDYQKILKDQMDKNDVEPVEFLPYLPDAMFSSSAQEINNKSYIKTLQCIEDMIGEDTVKSFRDVGESDKWSGRVEDTSLFNLWKKLSNLSKTDNSEQLDEYEEEMSLEFHLEDPLKICTTYMSDT